MTRSQLSGCSMRTRAGLNPHLEGCHLLHHSGTPRTGRNDWRLLTSSLIAPLKDNHYKVFCSSASLRSPDQQEGKGGDGEACSIEPSPAGACSPCSNINISFMRPGRAVQAAAAAAALQECLGPKYGLFWCLAGIDVRATYFLVRSE